jgi:hypothetical protein
MDEPWIAVRDFTATESDDVAARRAARSLERMGLVRIFGGDGYRLLQVTPAPDMPCPHCGDKCSGLYESPSAEHLNLLR